MGQSVISGSDNVSITVTVAGSELVIAYRPAGRCEGRQTIFIAIGTHREIGAAILPFGRDEEGSTVFLPWKADLLLSAETGNGDIVAHLRKWERWRWGERERTRGFRVDAAEDGFVFRIPHGLLGSENIDFVVYAKDLTSNDGWGWLWGCSDQSVQGGHGDKFIPRYHELRISDAPRLALRGTADNSRVRIYQLFVRLFGNSNETRKQNGTLAENGSGKFADINDAALEAIAAMGFTHIWLTGVLQQATATDYTEWGQPADDTDLLKGLAGSPYAIKDYFDVGPDYAVEPARRLDEFRELIERMNHRGLRAIIDLVANHVARSYRSCMRPDCDFGAADDPTKFFHPHNNFFYLKPDENGPPLRLPTFRDGVPLSPTCQLPAAECDGLFAGETTIGRVTGNNCVSWTPQLHDWYETIKLNYGFDFTDPSKSVREYPNAWTPDKPIPST